MTKKTTIGSESGHRSIKYKYKNRSEIQEMIETKKASEQLKFLEKRTQILHLNKLAKQLFSDQKI